MIWKLNLKDEHGYIRTGYEQIIEGGTKEAAITDYLNWLDDPDVTAADIDIQYQQGQSWYEA